jgi:hypothetical protein
MGVLDIVPVSQTSAISRKHRHSSLQQKAGVLTGDETRRLFDYAKEHQASDFTNLELCR